MKRLIGLAVVLVLLVGGCPAPSGGVESNTSPPALEPPAPEPAPQRPIYAPYPGGSPFRPGGEPSMTHVAHAFWTTRGGMVTLVDVAADGGSRPTQVDLWKVENGKRVGLGAAINPGCNYHFRLAATRQEPAEGVQDWTADGEGLLEVRVFGFERADWDHPPTVKVHYLRAGKPVGETGVAVQPIPDKLKPKAPAPEPDTTE